MRTEIRETLLTLPEIGTTALEVTQQDVASANRALLTSCPVATAFKRMTGKDAIVFSNGVRVCEAYGAVARFRTSSDLDQMIQAYDKGADFQPGYYTLTPFK